jgi:hypothetical protein
MHHSRRKVTATSDCSRALADTDLFMVADVSTAEDLCGRDRCGSRSSRRHRHHRHVVGATVLDNRQWQRALDPSLFLAVRLDGYMPAMLDQAQA